MGSGGPMSSQGMSNRNMQSGAGSNMRDNMSNDHRGSFNSQYSNPHQGGPGSGGLLGQVPRPSGLLGNGPQRGGSMMNNRGVPPGLRPPGMDHNVKDNIVNDINDALNNEIWIETKTADGKFYFYNAKTRETTWTRPEGNVKILTQDQVMKYFYP